MSAQPRHPSRVRSGVPTGGQFAATHRTESNTRLDDGTSAKAAVAPGRPDDRERGLLVDVVVSARGEVHEAQRAVRTAERGLARSFEFPPLKALATRRVRKARERLSASTRALDTAERRLRDRDDSVERLHSTPGTWRT